MIFLCKLLLAMGLSAVSAMPKAAETIRPNDRELQGSIVSNDGVQRQSSTNITVIRDTQSSRSIAGFQQNESVKLKIETEDFDKDNLPFISGGGLPGRYYFEQLHFHWGEGSRGSEHKIDGQQYAAELHIVHYNAKYENFMEASGEEGGVAALAILIELQARDNKVFRHLQQFEAIIDPTENDSDKLDVPFPLDDLLPDSTESFFRYNGSLTTPVFTEGVIWTIFDTPIAISKGQLAKFRSLLDKEGNRIKENVREIQELNDREVFYRAEQNAEDNDLPDDDERLSRDS
ncbi:alpha-carbonic anhydrase [Daphnia sinensis]|uniref:Carbonic anhydrase n=1 Tax=Daphnia sinensis TaxID=1820382 RepID=A0AAD5PXE8_9CRUS|nr:alpha-carbonic anhydrase [Daphnia sinensis]